MDRPGQCFVPLWTPSDPSVYFGGASADSLVTKGSRAFWTFLEEDLDSEKSLLYHLRTLLGAPGLTTRSKDATRGSWPHY